VGEVVRRMEGSPDSSGCRVRAECGRVKDGQIAFLDKCFSLFSSIN
jgi:hypothetical protein